MVRRYFFLIAALAAVSTGCADDGTSLRIECPVPPQQGDNVCTYDADSEVCVLRGLLNLAEAREYRLVLKVTNGLSSRQTAIPLRPEPNNMDVQSAEVALVTTSGELLSFTGLPNPFSVTASGRVPVGGSGIASVQAIPPDYMVVMANENFQNSQGTIVIRVKVNARTDGDVPVESRTWRWPVDLGAQEGAPDNCVPADEPQLQCSLGQDFEFVPYCSNL